MVSDAECCQRNPACKEKGEVLAAQEEVGEAGRRLAAHCQVRERPPPPPGTTKSGKQPEPVAE
jgi:hypothetical protein